MGTIQDNYVVAVSDTLEQIHTDWHWVEQNLFRQMDELDQATLDEFLLAKFEDLARANAPSGARSAVSNWMNASGVFGGS